MRWQPTIFPFYRSTVGFDRVFNRLDALVGQEQKTYPPYNIEKLGNDAYRISIAVAGFAEGDIAIETKENNWSSKAPRPRRARTSPANSPPRHCRAAFELRFQLADYVEVDRCFALENGLLHVELKREIPESKKASPDPDRGRHQDHRGQDGQLSFRS